MDEIPYREQHLVSPLFCFACDGAMQNFGVLFVYKPHVGL